LVNDDRAVGFPVKSAYAPVAATVARPMLLRAWAFSVELRD
jgi:hypothetical protein